jgi:hypothetical protein
MRRLPVCSPPVMTEGHNVDIAPLALERFARGATIHETMVL